MMKLKKEENNNKLWSIRLQFGETYNQCKARNEADWKLFVNTVDMLLKALSEFDTLEFTSPIISLGFSKQFKVEMEKLEKLQTSLIKREMVIEK